MFNKQITNSDDFLEMPISSQCLYFHLGLHADDDGFITNPDVIQRAVGAAVSDTENLVYIDFDVVHDVDITVYPDSNKIGVWGMGINQIFPQASNVDYYDGE